MKILERDITPVYSIVWDNPDCASKVIYQTFVDEQIVNVEDCIYQKLSTHGLIQYRHSSFAASYTIT